MSTVLLHWWKMKRGLAHSKVFRVPAPRSLLRIGKNKYYEFVKNKLLEEICNIISIYIKIVRMPVLDQIEKL